LLRRAAQLLISLEVVTLVSRPEDSNIKVIRVLCINNEEKSNVQEINPRKDFVSKARMGRNKLTDKLGRSQRGKGNRQRFRYMKGT
jgi:hypothetical protein